MAIANPKLEDDLEIEASQKRQAEGQPQGSMAFPPFPLLGLRPSQDGSNFLMKNNSCQSHQLIFEWGDGAWPSSMDA